MSGDQKNERNIEQPIVSIVVLSYNSIAFLEQFLPSLIKFTPNKYEVVVVDNGSTDSTDQFLKEHYPQLRTIILKNNVGFADGYVRSLVDIKSKYYCLINADIQVEEGWIEPMVELLENNPNVGACQPKIKSFNKPTHFEYAGACGGYVDFLGYPFCRGRLFFNQEEDLGQYDTPIEIFWASGACVFFRADLYHKIGGFDGEFISHMEEIDLCWRIKNEGYRIMVVPQSVVYHVGGSIISYGSPFKLYQNFRNNLILLTKNLKGSELWWKLPLRSFLDVLAAIHHVAKGEFKLASTIIKANLHFYLRFNHWYTKRESKKTFFSTKSSRTVYQKSIVLKYFLFGKKKFGDLNWLKE